MIVFLLFIIVAVLLHTASKGATTNYALTGVALFCLFVWLFS